MSPYTYINAIFDAKLAKNGGVVRRKVACVQKYASINYLKLEVERRGFHLIESGGYYLIICNPGGIRLIR